MGRSGGTDSKPKKTFVNRTVAGQYEMQISRGKQGPSRMRNVEDSLCLQLPPTLPTDSRPKKAYAGRTGKDQDEVHVARDKPGGSEDAGAMEHDEYSGDDLPAHVISALLQRRRSNQCTASHVQCPDPHARVSGRRAGHPPHKRSRLQAGSVTVEVLDQNVEPKPSESAISFRQSQLMGEKRKRSLEMLSSRSMGVASVFVR
eukprot:jgi/Botrbrau1/4079/Bobra.152_3s0031.1